LLKYSDIKWKALSLTLIEEMGWKLTRKTNKTDKQRLRGNLNSVCYAKIKEKKQLIGD